MDKKKAIEHFTKANELYEKDNIKNASSEIDLAIKLDSSNLDFQLTKAKIIAATDNFELALEILKEVSSKNFKLDTVNYLIGSFYLRYGLDLVGDIKANDNYEKAKNFYNIAINSNMQYFDAYVGKSTALHNLERYDDALMVLNTAIKLFPDSISLISRMGTEKIYLGDLSGAMIDLNKSIQSKKLDSSSLAEAHRFRGNLYVEKGKLEEAINDYTNSIKYDGTSKLNYIARAECYKEKGLKDKACEDYRKAAELGLVFVYEIIKKYCADKGRHS
jgi:tetratricopeptide (TPR) repeat protein